MTENSVLCNFIVDHPDDWSFNLCSNPKRITVRSEGNLSIFNYSAGSDFMNPEVQEARGIIINMDDLNVVCWPFRKFGNYGESYADTIDWSSARVQDKLDGSIMKLWFDIPTARWRVSSNKQITPQHTDNSENRLDDVFWMAAKEQGLNLWGLDTTKTYIFELTGPDTKVILNYKNNEIWHIGTRSNVTGQEFDEDIGIQKPKEYPITSLEECIQAAEELNADGITKEGFVVVDKDWHRIKVKSPVYIKAVHMGIAKDSTGSMIDIIQNGEEAEYLTYFPEEADNFTALRKRIQMLKDMITEYQSYMRKIYDRCDHDRKRFALAIQRYEHKDWGFAMLKDLDADDIVSDMTSRQLASMIEENTADNGKVT